MKANAHAPAEKWIGHPNLRLRPHAPNTGKGRLQVQIARAFVAGGPVQSSSEIYDWTFVRRRARLPSGHRHSVRRILIEIAEKVGRAATIGRPWLWRLKSPENRVTDTPVVTLAATETTK